jgi:predicted TIM-barrel fold metal-dependent hydrolase
MDERTPGGTVLPGSPEWFAQVVEDVVDPGRVIIDPHHHLWRPGAGLDYGLDQLKADVNDGHRIECTVFMECGSAYDVSAPPHLAPVGETEFIAGESLRDPDRTIRGIVSHADLTLPNLDEVLDAHAEAGRGMFRGIRDALSRADDPASLTIPGRAAPGKFRDPAFVRGVRRLGERGLTYDSWHYHHQNREFLELARAAEGTQMVLDHFGTPLGVGEWAGRHDEIFPGWCADIEAIAACPNVVAKIGGLAMPDNGFGWHTAQRPPTSDEFVAAQARWYLHVIEAFGPDRCMFESNFPVDRLSLSYRTFWNAAKKMVASFSESEKDAMFRGTAARVYSV